MHFDDASTRPQVWAIGGGKGGTGKSLVAASFGIHLSQMGRRVVLIDGDLGAANLHTFFGIDPPGISLGDFIERRVATLDEAAVPTGIPRLRLISGARNGLEAESLKYFQKTRLLRVILDLAADVVIVDLGAGTSLNVLDLFGIADRGVVVVLPEPTSIENAYRFMLAALRRRLRCLGRALGFQSAIEAVLDGSARSRPDRPHEILEDLARFDVLAADAVRSHLGGYLPHLVINQARGHDDAQLGDSMRLVCDRFLGLPIHYAGAIPYDPVLVRTIKSRSPALMQYPRSGTSESFRAAAEEIGLTRGGPDTPERWWGGSVETVLPRDPHRILDVPRGAPHREILSSYLRLRSTLRTGSMAFVSLDCEAERRAAIAEVEHAFRSISRNTSAGALRSAPGDGPSPRRETATRSWSPPRPR